MSAFSILLVEDNPLTQKITKDLLLAKNCAVDIAGTGSEALEKFKARIYQMILVDIGLPDLTGYELTQHIRNYEVNHHQPPAWIIGLTADVEKEEFYQGIHAGMNDIYCKPLSAQLLTDILQIATHSLKAEPISRDSFYNKTNGNRVIDLNLSAKILGSTIETAKKMLAELVKMLPDDLKKMQTAFANKDYVTLKNLANYVKGGSSSCGTPRLKDAANSLYQAIKSEQNEAEITIAYQQLCREISAVVNEYQQYNKS